MDFDWEDVSNVFSSLFALAAGAGLVWGAISAARWIWEHPLF